MRLSFVMLLGLTVGACSNPNAPTLVNGVNVAGMTAWATAHAGEMCVALNDGAGRGVYGSAELLPLGSPIPEGGRVVAISYCNPAE
jgi:hypothetical protein